MAAFFLPHKTHSRIILAGLISALLLSACESVPEKSNRLTDEQIAALKDVGFESTDQGWEFSKADKLLFGSNLAALTPEAKGSIERIGNVLVKIHVERVRVDGHTDSDGSTDYNQQLSMRRAKAVASVLTDVGIPNESVTVRGRGKSAPIASNSTPEGRAQNRRVAIVITAN